MSAVSPVAAVFALQLYSDQRDEQCFLQALHLLLHVSSSQLHDRTVRS